MALIAITAKKATFSRSASGLRMKCVTLFDDSQILDRRTIETTRVADIEAAMREIHDAQRARDPAQSFEVSASMARRGDRKPNGFARMERCLEYDPSLH